MIEIPLTRGRVALVDSDCEWLLQWNWQAVTYRCKNHSLWYAKRGVWDGRTMKSVPMHRAIMAPPDGLVVDHIDGDGLNNQRSNLRLCTHRENVARSRQPTSRSGYIGVVFVGKRFRARIFTHGKWKNLGLYNCPQDAARAYDAAAFGIYGAYARVNFPSNEVSHDH